MGFGDMEDLPVGSEIVRFPLHYPPVSKPNDDFILCLAYDNLTFSTGVQQLMYSIIGEESTLPMPYGRR